FLSYLLTYGSFLYSSTKALTCSYTSMPDFPFCRYAPATWRASRETSESGYASARQYEIAYFSSTRLLGFDSGLVAHPLTMRHKTVQIILAPIASPFSKEKSNICRSR